MRSCSGPAVASSKFSPSVPVTNQRLYRYNVIPSVCAANRLSNCTLHVWCSSLEQHFVVHFACSVHMYRCIVVLCYAVEDNEHFLSFAFLYLAPFVSTIFLLQYSPSPSSLPLSLFSPTGWWYAGSLSPSQSSFN